MKITKSPARKENYVDHAIKTVAERVVRKHRMKRIEEKKIAQFLKAAEGVKKKR